MFVLLPNLPQNTVNTVIIGEKYLSVLQEGLSNRNVGTVVIPENPMIAEPECYHADMLVCHLYGDKILLDRQFQSNHHLLDLLVNHYGFSVYFSAVSAQEKYPKNILLNSLRIGKYTFGLKAHTEPSIIKSADHFISVRQGYAKCSVCVVNEKAAITADVGLKNAMEAVGIEVLQINPGHITMASKDDGFIGGSSGKLGRNIIAFTGRLDEHPDKLHILSFLKKHQVAPIYLTDRPIFDVGSILPITESPEES